MSTAPNIIEYCTTSQPLYLSTTANFSFSGVGCDSNQFAEVFAINAKNRIILIKITRI
jgi:hypothetical protein